MVFNRLLGALGVGGPSVDTVLSTPTVRPGGQLIGQVNLVGGSRDTKIAGITLHLVAHVEIEHDDHESQALASFASAQIAGPLSLRAEERQAVEFSIAVPYEAPISAIPGRQHLHGMGIGVRTEVDIDGGRDKGDTDLLNIEPLPVQQRVIDAFTALGFHLKGADLEAGHIAGSGQTLPFYQEIEFDTAPQYAHACSEVELTFIATPFQTEVVLEIDRRSNGHSRGGDTVNRHVLEHSAADENLSATVDAWIRQATEHSGISAHQHHGHADQYSHDTHDDHHDDRRGPGIGAVVAGAAAGAALGFAGGMIAEELVDEIFDDED